MTLPISIIIPCYNEAGTIGALLEAILGQTHPMEQVEVLVVDGGSQDGTRAIVRAFAESHPQLDLCLVDNPQRTIPAALNRGLERARGEVIVRLDAHAAPNPDYLQRCLETLGRTGAANVGGAWDIRPGAGTWVARSIAVAAAHPLGAGDARYRVLGPEGEVDTVPFGAFRRAWIERVGRFNEQLLTNEDYEFNLRLRSAGGKVWFDPRIRSAYFARSDLPALARQYFRYGYWKARMLLRYPGSLRWRQALPPLLVASSLALAAGSIRWSWARVALGVEWGLYGLTVAIAALMRAVRSGDAGLLIGFPLAILTMHVCWGTGFLWSLLTKPQKR